MNTLVGLGRIGKELELKGEGEKMYTTIAVAVDYGFKDSKRTEWFNLVAFGKKAEIICTHLSKGRQIFFEAEPKTNKYQDKDGNNRQSLGWILRDFKFASDGSAKPNNVVKTDNAINFYEGSGDDTLPF